MSKNKFSAQQIAVCAILIAIYFPLSALSPEFSGIQITFDSLPVTIGAMLGGPLEGFLVGLLGELLAQIVRYGLSVTTVLWILPRALRGLIIGLGCVLFKKKMSVSAFAQGRPSIVYFIVCIVAAIFTSLGNTLAYYVDSIVFGYYNFALIFGVAGIRLISNVISSVLMAIVTVPVLLGLRKAGIASANK